MQIFLYSFMQSMGLNQSACNQLHLLWTGTQLFQEVIYTDQVEFSFA